jgi:polyisoprenoid-binding protein YceI
MAVGHRMLHAIPEEQGGDMSTALIETETAVERWNADPSRTKVEFEIRHLWGLHRVRGRFDRFDGSYVVGPAGTEIELAIDAASVDTGIARRDEHLRSPDFFFAAAHPQVRFRSTYVTGLGKGNVHVSGTLEAAGRTVPIAFDASVAMIDGELQLEATTTVDPRRFGMSEGPLRNIRPPATLHVKALLVRERPAYLRVADATGGSRAAAAADRVAVVWQHGARE